MKGDINPFLLTFACFLWHTYQEGPIHGRGAYAVTVAVGAGVQ